MHCIGKRGWMGIALSAVAALSACGGGGGSSGAEKAGSKVKVQFAVGDAQAATLAAQARATVAPVTGMWVTVEDAAGRRVLDQVLPVYAFGQAYVSQQVELEVGAYRLTRFLVVDGQNTVVYAAPVNDASADPTLVAKVQRPLPIAFEATQGVVHDQPVEVLPVGDHTAQQLGYGTSSSFSFKIENSWAKSALRVSYAPGPDGVYGTSDDVPASYNLVVMDEDGDSKNDAWFSGSGFGPDGVPFTADDAPSGWWWERVKDTYGSNQSGPGEDGIWWTADDTISSWEDFGSRSGNTTVHRLYSSPGADGIWFTADDVMSGYYKMEVNAYGGETKRVYYSSPGWDGIWMTADDVVGQDWFGSYVVNTYDGRNSKWMSWDRQVSYVGTGWDGTWFTSDDTIGACRTHEFADGTQYWTTERTYSPGVDGICFTLDDQLVGFARAVNSY